MVHILLVAYHFPPINNGGVKRSRSFVKYWIKNGCNVTVLSTNYKGEDPDECDGAKVERTMELQSLASWINNQSCPNTSTEKFRLKPTKEVRLLTYLKTLYRTWLFIPDISITWAIFAVWKALKIVKKEPSTVIFTTSPPESSHLIGYGIKKLTGCKWIMDMRDPWSFESVNSYRNSSILRKRIDTFIERSCLRAADNVITNTQNAHSRYMEIYPYGSHKLHCITNGFDPEDFDENNKQLKQQPEWLRNLYGLNILSHVGTFSRYGDKNIVPETLLRAIRELLDEGLLNTECFRLVLAGNQTVATRARLEKFKLESIAVLPGVLDHEVAIELMKLSNVLFIFDTEKSGKYYIHGKLFEYLAARKTILAILPNGSSKNLLIESGLGVFAPNDNVAHLKQSLLKAISSKNENINPNFDMAAYSYERLAEKALELIR